ncbi:MAG: metallophosphoesterase [Candidatus Azobacteroides sp.]|nr:metallophosphoesterase [Candidatus Azobacteroides sp.]
MKNRKSFICLIILFVLHIPFYGEIRAQQTAVMPDECSIMQTIPYLQSPTETSMIVRWITKLPCRGSVEFASDMETVKNGRGKKVYMFDEGTGIGMTQIHRVKLENLESGKIYFYRICSQPPSKYEGNEKIFNAPTEQSYSEIYTFKTVTDSGNDQDFSILLFNDIQNRIHFSLFETTFKPIIDQTHYDLVIFNGDHFNELEKKEDLIYWLNQYAYFVNASSVPVIFVRGEQDLRGSIAHLIKEYIEYVKDGESYGAINIGNTRLLFLDAGEDKPDHDPDYSGLADYDTYRFRQQTFLDTELNSPEFKNASKRVLLHHIPLFYPAGNLPPFNPDFDFWAARLNQADIDIALNGHIDYHYADKNTCEYGGLHNNYPIFSGSLSMGILNKIGNNIILTTYKTDGSSHTYVID